MTGPDRHQVDVVASRLPFPIGRRARNASPSTTSPTNPCPGCVTPIRCAAPTGASIPRPDGRPAPGGPLIDAVEDKFEVVAAGEAVATFAGHDIRALRPDLPAIPLDGVDPSHVVLATRADDRSRLVAAFRKYAQAHLVRPESS
jgi:hypothetical protein